jgi:Bacteriophage head to tail connecting protein
MAKAENNKPEEGAKTLYDRLTQERDNYTQRAEKNATYTIPQLFPKESDDGGTSYESPYNSVGARGLNNLASKLLLALLPPSQPFFRLGLDPESNEALKNSGDDQLQQQINYSLAMMEQAMIKYMEANSIRPTLFEIIKQLLISGNALLFLPPLEGGMRAYTLRNYVVQRDTIGNVIQIVAKDTLSRGTLPPALQTNMESSGDEQLDEKVDIYTHIYLVRADTLEGSTWESYQEIDGEIVSGSEQSYPYGKCPWIPVRFSKKDGESYGRSFVEDYIGDLISLENLTNSIVDMSMISAKVLFLVSPQCQTNIRALAKADNGAFVRGRQEDIVPMQLGKSQDMSTVLTTAQAIEQRLSFAFLLNSAVQRSAERVTATEIQYVANELEATLGGVYSLLSNELQLPLVACVFNQMQSQQLLPEFDNNLAEIEPTIITGVDALGRGQELINLQQAIQMMSAFPEFMQALNVGNLAMRIFEASHIDTTGLVKTPEQLAQEQQAQMEQYAEQTAVDAGAQMAVNEAQAQQQM